MRMLICFVLFAALVPVAAAAQASGSSSAAAVQQATGTPPGVAGMRGNNSTGFPTPKLAPGQPIETRAPEMAGDKPDFANQTRAPYRPTSPFNVATLTDGLKSPWSLAFLPDGRMLVTEKGGDMRTVDAKGGISQPLKGVPAVVARGQVGLLDLALDPAFARNHRLFFSFAEPRGTGKFGISIARATLNQAANGLENVSVIFRAQPALPESMAANSGGRIAIAPGGTLFVTIGDRSRSPPWDVAQKLDNDLGKIIHITADGAPAPGNPFIGRQGALPEIWSYGHRSEEGLAIEPATGQLWENENGPRGGDEVNKIEAGKDYGWPVALHGIDYPGETIGKGITQEKDMVSPVYYWDPVIAPSGMAFYTGTLFPQWKNSLFVGAMRGEMLDRLEMSGGKVVGEEPLLVDLHNRLRDVRVGPDGAVYVLTDEGKLLKLTPK